MGGKVNAATIRLTADAIESGLLTQQDPHYLFYAIFVHFEAAPAGHEGINYEAFVNFLGETYPTAAASLMRGAAQHMTLEGRVRQRMWIIRELGKRKVNGVDVIPDKKTRASVKQHYTEWLPDGTKKVHEYRPSRIQLVPNQLNQALCRPRPLPFTGTPRLYFCGHFDQAEDDLKSLLQSQTFWNFSKVGAKNLIAASAGVALNTLNWNGEIVFPRNNGVSDVSPTSYDDYMLNCFASRHMTYVKPQLVATHAGLQRCESFFENFAQTQIPITDEVIFHFAKPELVMMSAKTLGCIASKVKVEMGGGNISRVAWSLGEEKEGAYPSARVLNPSFADRRFKWDFEESADVYDRAGNESWPLSEARLVGLGYTPARSKIIHHLMKLIGFTRGDEDLYGRIKGGLSRTGKFPGTSVV